MKCDSSTAGERIELADLPARLRELGEQMEVVGAALRYYGGFGPFGEWGDVLESQSAPMCREIANALEAMLAARVGQA